MRRFFALLAALLLLLNLLEPMLPSPARPAWPGRVADGKVAGDVAAWPAEGASPDQPSFREGLLTLPETLVPLLPGGDNPVTRLLFRGLARLDKEGRPVPDLAAGWMGKGGTDWVVRLRPGLLWHDGEPVTAADVVFTLRAAAHPALQNLAGSGAAAERVRRRAALWASRQVEAVDERTVRITLDRPDASLPRDLTLPLLPAHLLAAVPDPTSWAAAGFAAAPVGTGPFRWQGVTDGVISLAAFQQAGGWPRLEGYSFVPLGGEDEAWQGLAAGKLDGVAFGVRPAVPTLVQGDLQADAPGPEERAAELGLASRVFPGTEALLLLWSGRSDRELRQAVAALVSSAGQGSGLWPPYPGPGHSGVATALDSLGWTAGADGWRQRQGQTLQVLLDLAEGQAASRPLREEAVAHLVRPLRDAGVQVLVAEGPTTAAKRQAVPLAARLVLWEGGSDPDLYNLVAALPDVEPELLRRAAVPRGLLADDARAAALAELARLLQADALVTPLARSRQVFVTRRSLGQEALNPFDRYSGIEFWPMAGVRDK